MSDKADIWMPLYIGDYMADTIGLTFAEHGLYLLLIMSYWRKGSALSDCEATDIMRGASVEECSRIAKFFHKACGKWHHKRIDREIVEASENKKMRKLRATIASNARWKAQKQPSSKHPKSILVECPSPSPSPSISVEREYGEISRPSLREVLDKADMIGLAPWKAEDWYNEMESCGWKDHSNRIVEKWIPMLTRIRTKWEADGRPSGPPKSRAYPPAKINNHNV